MVPENAFVLLWVPQCALPRLVAFEFRSFYQVEPPSFFGVGRHCSADCSLYVPFGIPFMT